MSGQFQNFGAGKKGGGGGQPFYRLENDMAVHTCVDIIFSGFNSHAPPPPISPPVHGKKLKTFYDKN